MSKGVKPRVGISSCLLGHAVRYDGGHKRDDPLIHVLGPHVEWVPVCPEVDIGLGTPRPPIDLYEAPDGPRLIMPSTGRDLTMAMREYAARKADALAAMRVSGYVLKSRSPSCGLGSARVLTAPAEVKDHAGTGLFAAALRARLPDLPVEEESRLQDANQLQRFLERILSYRPGRF